MSFFKKITTALGGKPPHAHCGRDRGELIALGVRAQETGDYKTAFAIWSEFAERKEAVGIHNLGTMYLEGQGVSRDLEKATRLLATAAMMGSAPSSYILGCIYLRAKDFITAADWLKKAHQDGDVTAAAILVTMYLEGLGVPRDEELAAEWLAKGNGAIMPLQALLDLPPLG